MTVADISDYEQKKKKEEKKKGHF